MTALSVDLNGLSPDVLAEIDAILRAPRPLPDSEYERDPLGWAQDVMGVPRETIDWVLNDAYKGHDWDGTPNPMRLVLDSLANWESVGVESATTTGKTFLAALVVLWFLACFENAFIPTVAPKQDQLELHLWKEIGKLWPKFHAAYPRAERSYLRIRIDGEESWSAFGFVAGVRADEVEGSASKAQGHHAEHMLIVFEETPGIAPAIMTAFKNTCRAPHNLRLALGNPDNQHDELHRFCKSARVRHVIVSAYDHPNIVTDDPSFIPGAVSRQGIDDAIADDGKDSDMFKSRVRGLSPAQSVHALIRQEWLDAAAARFELTRDTPFPLARCALGVDVAQSERGDKSAVARWRGNRLVDLEVASCPNATALGREVWATMQEWNIDPWHVGVDPVGVGAATVNLLDEKTAGSDLPGWNVQQLNGGLAAMDKTTKAPDGSEMDWVTDANLFKNLRCQMYWQLREDLRTGRVAIPRIPSLHKELTTPTYEKKAGKVIVQSKDEIKKVTGHSPDSADAVVYGNWVRARTPTEAKQKVNQDDQHPGFNYEKRVAKSWSFEDENASNDPHVPVGWRMPR